MKNEIQSGFNLRVHISYVLLNGLDCFGGFGYNGRQKHRRMFDNNHSNQKLKIDLGGVPFQYFRNGGTTCSPVHNFLNGVDHCNISKNNKKF